MLCFSEITQKSSVKWLELTINLAIDVCLRNEKNSSQQFGVTVFLIKRRNVGSLVLILISSLLYNTFLFIWLPFRFCSKNSVIYTFFNLNLGL